MSISLHKRKEVKNINSILWYASETLRKPFPGRTLEKCNRPPAEHLKAFNRNQRCFSYRNSFSTDWLYFLTHLGICGIPHQSQEGSNLLLKISWLRFKITVNSINSIFCHRGSGARGWGWISEDIGTDLLIHVKIFKVVIRPGHMRELNGGVFF